MINPVTRIDKALKTKEDMQSFVLIAFVLFIIFVKLYMMATDPKATAKAGHQRNADIAKIEVKLKS